MKLTILITGVAWALLGTAASAATLFTQDTPTGALTSPGSVSYQFEANAGAGLTSFTLNGYASLDGAGNGYTDVFTLSLNGTGILSGSYNLGGGGYDITYFAPVGSSVSISTPGSLPVQSMVRRPKLGASGALAIRCRLGPKTGHTSVSPDDVSSISG